MGLEVMRLLREASRERGCAVVVVTHDDSALAFADRVIRMRDGRIVSDERIAEPGGDHRSGLMLLPRKLPRDLLAYRAQSLALAGVIGLGIFLFVTSAGETTCIPATRSPSLLPASCARSG